MDHFRQPFSHINQPSPDSGTNIRQPLSAKRQEQLQQKKSCDLGLKDAAVNLVNLPLLVYESHKEAKSKTVMEKKTCFHLSLFQGSKAKKAQSQNYNSILTIFFFLS